MATMNQPPILNIKIGMHGVQLVINALAKMPFEQVADLIAVIKAQAEMQLNPPQVNAPATASITAEVAPRKKRGGRPKGSRNKAKAVPAPAPVTLAEESEGATAD